MSDDQECPSGGGEGTRDSSRDIHTMPTKGPEHTCSKDCWCEPKISYEDEITGARVYLHKGYEELNQ